jgi:inner membrane protein
MQRCAHVVDNLTHSLVGALIGQAGLKRRTGLAMPALIIGANLPDVDAACFFWLDGVQHLGFRRGITHGPIAWVLLPLILAGALWLFDRWQARRGKRPEGRLPVHFGWLYALGFIACLTHPALDWLNVYGVRFLEPFSSRWFYGDTLFIIDVWLWLGLGLATWLSLRREKRGGEWRQIGRWALVGALCYVFLNWMITLGGKSMIHAREYHTADAIVVPVPLNPFRRDLVTVTGGIPGKMVLVDGKPLGDAFLHECNFVSVRARNPSVDAFLFWSRAPFVERLESGEWKLSDARFASRGGRFSVTLPEATCRPDET